MKDNSVAIRPADTIYPSRVASLIGGALLSCLGNIQLLTKPCIGICGSRDASNTALEYAYAFGSEAAKRDLVVVSGHARGVDRAAHRGAMESGGSTIAVLAEGINGFSISRELKPYVKDGRNFLAVSMFPEGSKWLARRAMERNKLIVGLSSGMFVIEARETGGTINAGWECIRQGKNLWVVAYPDNTTLSAGSRLLLDYSAIPLNVNDIGDVGEALDVASLERLETATQLSLGLV